MKFYYNKNTEKLIIKESTSSEYNYLKNYLCKKVDGHEWNPKVKMGIWNGLIDNFHGGYIDVGLWKRCYEICRIARKPFEIINKEDFPINHDIKKEHFVKFVNEFFKDRTIDGKPFFPYEHQIEAAFKILRNRYCRVEVATSGGKSLIYSMVLFYLMKHVKPDGKFLLIVPSITLVTQFYDDLIDYNEGFNKENKNTLELRMEEIMSDRPRKHFGQDNPNLYIATYQSLDNDEVWKKEFFQQFYCVTVDESHKAKAKTLKAELEKTRGAAFYRFGLSGTYPKEGTTAILDIESVTGPLVINVRADYLMKKDLVAGLMIKTICLDHNDTGFAEKINNIKKHNPRKALDLEVKYVQDSDKRMEFIVKKLIGKADKNVLLLFHNTDHGRRLEDFIRFMYPEKEVHYIDGGVNNKKRSEIKARMKLHEPDNPKVLVASYGTLSTGVSINAIFYIIFADSFKSDVVIRQSIGRGLRKHKDKDKVVVFDITDIFNKKSNKGMLFNQSRARKRIYDEQNYEYKDMNLSLHTE
jgi:superfamily II DNA or RNA helicase